MIKHLPKILLLVLGFGCSQTSMALQTKPIKENGMAWATVSIQGLTRIAVNNDRIAHVRGPAGIYSIQNDVNQGAVFIQPSPENAKKPFTIFVATELNHNYSLRLTPTDQVADTILLKPTDATNPLADHWEKSSSYTDAVTQLMTDMATHDSPEGYSVSFVSKIKPDFLGSMASFELKQIYLGAHLEGRIYCVTNRTSQTVTVKESEFYQCGDRAIALSCLTIPPHGSTWLYKVVNHG